MPLTERARRRYGGDVRRLREARSWSRHRLAEESEVPESTIRDIEHGTAPREDTLSKLFWALGVEITTFGVMSTWMADQLGAMLAVAQRVPPDRLPEAMAAMMTILGRAARGQDIPDAVGPAVQTNIIASDTSADIDEVNVNANPA